MNHQPAAYLRWNVFARTLEDILQAAPHSTSLNRLDNLRERPGDELYPDDPESPRELVHREKVRRLIQSLEGPGTFPVLSREEMLRVERYFRLVDDEIRQLQAALLATYIERLIYERLSKGRASSPRGKEEAEPNRAAETALRVAEMALPALIDALRQLDDDDVNRFRGEAMMPSSADDFAGEDQIYQELAGALDAIDRGTLVLNLSFGVSAVAARIERARAAREAFSVAMAQLAEADAVVRTTTTWHIWHDEARRGLAVATERIVDLGG